MNGRQPRVPRPIEERIASAIRVDEQTGCHVWTWHRCRGGYGRIDWQGRKRQAHAVTYELRFGPPPHNGEIDHKCRNRACCNPDHLEFVSHRENVLRGNSFSAVNAAVTHCVNGHPFDDQNTAQLRRGGRACRACARERSRRVREQRAAA